MMFPQHIHIYLYIHIIISEDVNRYIECLPSEILSPRKQLFMFILHKIM